jgi:hypothetical protein
MKLSLLGMTVTLAMLAVNPLGAQRPTVIVDDTTSPFEAASVR